MSLDFPQVFMRKGRIFEVEAEQSIVSRGSASEDIYIVVSGQVLLHSSSVRGREFAIEVIRKGELFGLAGLFGTGHRVDATALTSCTVAALNVSSLQREVQEQPELAVSILKYMARHLMRRTEQAEDFALLSFAGRLAKLLLGMAESQGVRIAKGCKFRCDYSQTLMARMIGVSRETVSRQLQRWEDGGLMSHADKTICLLDPAALRRIADGFAEAE
jgi:CRP/FNR family transcriptional regulator